MTIRKSKSDSPNIDDLIKDIDRGNQLSQEENRFEEKIAALREATAALNVAADRVDIIIKGLNKAIEDIPTMSIGAQIAPDTLKALSAICDKFALDVANNLTAHRDKQLEQQKTHEERLTQIIHLHEQRITQSLQSHETCTTRKLRDCQGVWLSDPWMKFLYLFFLAFMLVFILYVKLG